MSSNSAMSIFFHTTDHIFLIAMHKGHYSNLMKLGKYWNNYILKRRHQLLYEEILKLDRPGALFMHLVTVSI